MRVWQTYQATVLFITHDLDEALPLADHIDAMSAAQGKIIRNYNLNQTRPRALNRENAALSDIHKEIMLLLEPLTQSS